MALDFPNSPPLNSTYVGPDGAVWKWDGTKWIAVPGVGAGGTVTGIATGAGLTGGPIQTFGTISAVPATSSTLGSVVVGSGISVTAGGTISAAAGGVTSITAGTGLTGGVITTAGTIALAPATASTLGGVIAGSGISITGGGTISVAGGGTTVTVADAAPGSPADGSMWFDSIGLQLYLRYNDGNSAQWVPTINQQGLLSDAPADGVYYTRRNNAWIGQTADPALVRTDVGRNLVHNSLFNIAQRGAGPFALAYGYTLDRWGMTTTGGSASLTQAALTDADRAAIGDESARYALQNVIVGGSAAGDFNYVWHPIEDIRRTAGKTVIVSFWARATAGTPKLGFLVYCHFGSGGSPSAGIVFGIQTFTLSTTWTRYVTTPMVVPSIAGKVFGTDGISVVQPIFCGSSGSTGNVGNGSPGVQSFTLQLWGVQLEVGSVATPLEKPDPQQDLAKCQRFYQTYGQLIVSGYAPTSINIYTDFPLNTPMRAAPSVVLSSTTYSNASGLVMGSSWTNHVRLQALVTAQGSAYALTDMLLSADL